MIGLDIGTTAVKAAQIQRKGRKYLVTGLARAPIEEADYGGDRAAAAVAAIQRCLYVLNRKDNVVCALSGPDVAVRAFDLPALAKKQLASAVELEAAQVCPFDAHEGAVAFQVLHGSSPRTRERAGHKEAAARRTTGILAAAKKPGIAQLQDWCRQAEARCIMVDVEGLALLNCLEACKTREPGRTVLVLNLGNAYANLAILGKDGMPFVQDIAGGGREIVDRLARHAKMAPDQAAAALAESEKTNGMPDHLRSGLREACAPLAERLTETLRYHGARQAGPAVDRILVCGGLAQTQAVVEIVGELVGHPLELWDPLADLAQVRWVRKSTLAERGPQFAVALGLAMRSVRDVHN